MKPALCLQNCFEAYFIADSSYALLYQIPRHNTAMSDFLVTETMPWQFIFSIVDRKAMYRCKYYVDSYSF